MTVLRRGPVRIPAYPARLSAQTAYPEAIDETDLSTQPARAQAAAWFSGQNGHSRWPQGHCSASGTWAQAAVRLNPGASSSGRSDEVNRLRSRPEYRAVSRGARLPRTGFLLQALRRDDPASPSRFGFTVTRKMGNAVTRNRILRRLKEAARTLEGGVPGGMDFVIIGRREAISRPFSTLVADLSRALGEAASGRGRRPVEGAH